MKCLSPGVAVMTFGLVILIDGTWGNRMVSKELY